MQKCIKDEAPPSIFFCFVNFQQPDKLGFWPHTPMPEIPFVSPYFASTKIFFKALLHKLKYSKQQQSKQHTECEYLVTVFCISVWFELHGLSVRKPNKLPVLVHWIYYQKILYWEMSQNMGIQKENLLLKYDEITQLVIFL